MRPTFRSMVLALLATLASLQAAAADGAGGAALEAPQPPPELEMASVGESEGHARFTWLPAGGEELAGVVFELEEACAEDFSDALLRYRGPARATFVSGLEEGPHWFRLRERPGEGEAAWSAWSAPILVEITPHPMALAWTLFGIGGTLFAAVVGFLVVMAARTRGEDEGELQGRTGEDLEAA